MSIGARLREERARLALNQEDFAALAGASKRAQLKWEKDESAPTATVLAAFADAGADVLYILTGRRSIQRPEMIRKAIDHQLEAVAHNLLDPKLYALPWQDSAEGIETVEHEVVTRLRDILRVDDGFMSPQQSERARNLLELATDREKLTKFRADELHRTRKLREEIKGSFVSWLEGGPYQPNDNVRNIMTMLALVYAVPVDDLLELIYGVYIDIQEQEGAGADSISSVQAKPR